MTGSVGPVRAAPDRPRPATLGTEGVAVRFGGLAALDDLTLALDRDEILGLIGPNGAGKSTLINVLSGFQRAATGRVRLDGRDITGRKPHELSRLGIARTFQAVRLFPGLTVLENVAAGFAGRPVGRRAARVRAREILDWIGLGAKAGLVAGTLPYGDERRVGIARALATGPAFLLLDEPAAGTNEEDIPRLMDMITRIRTEFGCGVLVVEHNMGLVMGLCGRVHVIDHGRTIAVGSPRAVQDDPEVRRAYLGEDEA